MPPEGDAKGTGEAQGSSEKIKVGEREYSAQDVQSMLAQQAEATRVLQEFAEVQRAAQRYGMSPADFTRQAEGSLAAIADLMDKKVIDEQGNLIAQGPAAGADDDDPFEVLLRGAKPEAPKGTPGPGGTPAELTGIQRALVQALGEIRGFKKDAIREIEALKRDNAALLKYNLSSKLRQTFPGLEDEEIDVVLERARGDRTKSLADHAKALLDRKTSMRKAAQLELAKQLGIENLDEHLTSLKQQTENGTAAALRGRKISFRPGKDSVSPREATEAFLNAQIGR